MFFSKTRNNEDESIIQKISCVAKDSLDLAYNGFKFFEWGTKNEIFAQKQWIMKLLAHRMRKL